jgi:hypothetical protein
LFVHSGDNNVAPSRPQVEPEQEASADQAKDRYEIENNSHKETYRMTRCGS